MSITRHRATTFALYVGLELKGAITSRRTTANAVATAINRSAAAFNRWLNGKVELPIAVLGEACEHIGVDPAQLVQAAYDRMVFELGELDDTVYEETGASAKSEVPNNVTDISSKRLEDMSGAEIEALPGAAHHDPDADEDEQYD